MPRRSSVVCARGTRGDGIAAVKAVVGLAMVLAFAGVVGAIVWTLRQGVARRTRGRSARDIADDDVA